MRKLYLLASTLLLVSLGCKAPFYQADTVGAERQTLDANSPTNSAGDLAEATIAPYREQLTEAMTEVIGQAETTLFKNGGESTLGNWATDLLYDQAVAIFPDQQIDFAIANSGGLRINELPAGPVRMEDMYRLMPFDNELVLVALNGVVFEEFLQYMARIWQGWPQSRQLRYRIEDGQAVDITVNGEAPLLNRNYLVAMPDYVANGGDDAEMLADRPQIKSGLLIRDLLIKAIREGAPVNASLDGRIE